MRLDIEFVIYAGLLVSLIIPLYIYRQRIFSFAYKTGNLEFFIKDLKLHMKKEHPKINFDYSIIEKTKDEKDIRIREILILEDIVNQFYNYEYIKDTQNPVPREKLWVGYDERSRSNPKVPNDWIERRELAWHRDNKRCNRCGTEISFNDMYTAFARDIKDGGGYNFENIIVLCSDCQKILNSQNPKNTIASLTLNDKLMVFVKA